MSVAKRRSNRTGRDPAVRDRQANHVRQMADAVRRGRIPIENVSERVRPEVAREAARKPMKRPEAPRPRDRKDPNVVRSTPGRP